MEQWRAPTGETEKSARRKIRRPALGGPFLRVFRSASASLGRAHFGFLLGFLFRAVHGSSHFTLLLASILGLAFLAFLAFGVSAR